MNCINQAKSAIKHFINAIKYFKKIKRSYILDLNEDLRIEEFADYEENYIN